MNRLTTEEGQLYACGYGYCNDETDCVCGNCHYTDEALKKLAEYEDLEEQDLLIKLPCKVDEKTKEQILFLCSNDGNLK